MHCGSTGAMRRSNGHGQCACACAPHLASPSVAMTSRAAAGPGPCSIRNTESSATCASAPAPPACTMAASSCRLPEGKPAASAAPTAARSLGSPARAASAAPACSDATTACSALCTAAAMLLLPSDGLRARVMICAASAVPAAPGQSRSLTWPGLGLGPGWAVAGVRGDPGAVLLQRAPLLHAAATLGGAPAGRAAAWSALMALPGPLSHPGSPAGGPARDVWGAQEAGQRGAQ